MVNAPWYGTVHTKQTPAHRSADAYHPGRNYEV